MAVRQIVVTIAFLGAFVFGAACSNGSLPASKPSSLGSLTQLSHSAATSKHYVYWTFFAATPAPQLQFAALPLKKTSKVTSIKGTSSNELDYTDGLAFDSKGQLWVLTYPDGQGCPATAAVFKTPLTQTSKPVLSFLLDKSCGVNALTFDSSGNLWVSADQGNAILQYKGPFTKSGTLEPAVDSGIYKPIGIAVTSNATLFVALTEGTEKFSIEFEPPPYNRSGSGDGLLTGLPSPGGIAFDRHGNLYASTNPLGTKHGALAVYDSDDLFNGAKPSAMDSKGQAVGSYEASFGFDASGNLYDADCGAKPGIYVYPTATKKLGPRLAPSVIFTDKAIQSAGCAWGVAIQ